MSEASAFYTFLALAFVMGAAAEYAWNALVREKIKPSPQLGKPYTIKIDCDNSNAIRGFTEAMEIADRYSIMLDEINAKSIQARENIQAIRPPKDLH